MFIFLAMLFVVIGILLFIKSTKLTGSGGMILIIKISSVGMVILGTVLFFFIANGNIVLPLV